MALIVRQEIVLMIMGGVFVMETLSVILQVVLQMTGKRIFRMAPLHHHYELKDGQSRALLCVLDNYSDACLIRASNIKATLRSILMSDIIVTNRKTAIIRWSWVYLWRPSFPQRYVV